MNGHDANGEIPDGLIKFTGELTQEQLEQFRSEWNACRGQDLLQSALVAGFRAQLELLDSLEDFA